MSCYSKTKWNKIENQYQKWGVAIQIPKKIGAALEVGNKQWLKKFRGADQKKSALP